MRADGDSEPSVWWVNHKQTFKQEVQGNYIWSPKSNKDGARNEFYENMTRVREGDLIISFANAAIQAVGICTEPAEEASIPSEFGKAGESWAKIGWKVGVRFSVLKTPMRPKDYIMQLSPTLPPKYSPIRKTGDGNQGAYLSAVPRQMFAVIKSILGEQWSKLDLTLRGPHSERRHDEDDKEEANLRNRTDIGRTEKESLVKARRGQGIYRKNLERFEKSCRVTGMAVLTHLRASHIMPWRMADDFQKLDGNNGLLLSPHIDHLFDQGYISFSDDGRLLASKALSAEARNTWHIAEGQKCGTFRKEQIPYIEFHRTKIFKSDD